MSDEPPDLIDQLGDMLMRTMIDAGCEDPDVSACTGDHVIVASWAEAARFTYVDINRLAALERVASDVAAQDPVAHSSEGLDDGCHYCGARFTSIRIPVVHDEDCTYLAAVAAVGGDGAPADA